MSSGYQPQGLGLGEPGANRSSSKTVVTRSGTAKSGYKFNSGQLDPALGQGADTSYQKFAQQQQTAQAMQKQVQQKAAPQHQTLLNKLQGAVANIGKAGQAVARPIADIGGAIGQEIQNKPVTNAGKFVHDTAQLSSDATGGLLNQFAKGVAQAPGAIAGEIASQSKNPYLRAQGVQAVQGAQKKAFGTNDSGTIAKKIAASTVGTGTLFAGGGELAGAKTLLKAGAKVAGKQVAKDAAIGATGNAAATVTQNPNATAKDIGKSAAVGGLLGAVAPHAIKGAGVAGRTVAEKTGVADNPVTNTLLGSVKQGHQDLLNAKANALLTKAQSLEPQAPAAAPVEPAPHVTYEPGNSKVKTLIDSAQKQQQAAEAPMKAAQAEQDKAAASAEQAQAQGQKIDRQIEILQAKAKDSETGLSNVDKTKLQHLQEDKAQVGATPQPGEVIKPTAPVEPVAKPVSESPNVAAPAKTETTPEAVAKESSANSSTDPLAGLKQEALKYKSADELAKGVRQDSSLPSMIKQQGNRYVLQDVPLSQVEHDYNGAGFVDKSASAKTIASYTKNCIYKPLVLDNKGRVLDGNHRALAALARGEKTVKAYVPEGATPAKFDNLHTRLQSIDGNIDNHYSNFGGRFNADLYNQAHTEAKGAKVEASPTNTKTNEAPQTKEPAVSETTRTLKPSETAHMPEVGGYTHSSHMAQDYADMLRGQELQAKGGQMVKNADGSYKRISEHSPFYRAVFKETGKAPNKADYLEQAKKELENGKDQLGAGEDYKKLLEREGKPVPRVQVASTVKDVPQGDSKIAQRIASDIKKNFGEQYKDGAKYDKITIEDQAKKAAALVSNREQLDKVISGEKPLPDGLRATSIVTAIRNTPELAKDGELLRRLASSPISSEASYSAQELRLAAENAKNDPIAAIKGVQKAKQDAYKARTGRNSNAATQSEIKAIRAATPKAAVSKETFASFVESLKC